MIKHFKPAVLILLQIFFTTVSYTQTNSVTENIAVRFIKYCKEVPREEIFVHTDREEYIAGEDLWFNLYLTDRQSAKPSVSAGIAYFELMNRENLPVVQKRIRLENGFGPGQIVLPDTLSTGIYTIRAYTNWMKNFLPGNCFIKEIKVYNALSTKESPGNLFFSNIKEEGPGSGLSSVNTQQLNFKVDNLKKDSLEIIIDSDPGYRSENNNTACLFIQTRGIINHLSLEKIQTDRTILYVPKSVLTPGINQITLFDSKGVPVTERLIYTPEKEDALPVITVTGLFKTREKTSVEIELPGDFYDTLNTINISISVTPQINNRYLMNFNEYMVFGTEFGIDPWKYLRGRKISDLSADQMDSLLLTLKSNWIEWKSILSDDQPVFKFKPEKSDHYLSGKLINRNSLNADSGRFVLLSTPGKVAQFQYARTAGDAGFSFKLPVDDLLKDLVIQPADPDNNSTVKIESSFSEKYYQTEIMSDSLDKPSPSHISKWSVNYQVQKIYGSSYQGKPLNPSDPPLKLKRFYGKPDLELILADYIKLPVMEEVFFELIPGVFLKKKKSVYDISVADPVDNRSYASPPGLFVDGVIIKDPSVIGNLDPENVEMIDIIRDRYFVGDYLFFGIVNVISKAGDYSSVSLPGYAVRLPYRVLDPVWSFESPDYSSSEKKNNRIPDFRNTLYWNPSVKPDKNGKGRIEFWTSDISSDYEINIQGITRDGKLISIRKSMKVE
jgi:hypothetical protein